MQRNILLSLYRDQQYTAKNTNRHNETSGSQTQIMLIIVLINTAVIRCYILKNAHQLLFLA